MIAGVLSGEQVVTAHGGGGVLTQVLVRERLLPALGNPALDALEDAAVLPGVDGPLVFTTDSYVVTPLRFPGGDIGRLAVCGTVNDLAVMGAEPLALSLGLILEEGLELATLDGVVASIAAAAGEAGVQIVTGDTKVIERRGGDEAGLLINTAGVGRLWPGGRPGLARVAPGDRILINGPIAAHGLAVMSVRNGLGFDTPLQSDVAPLNGLVGALVGAGIQVRFMRDATRGGLAGVLADIVEGCGLSVEVEEGLIPLSPAARQAADMLGLDPLTIANEGKLVCVVPAWQADRALVVLRSHPRGAGAAEIGVVTDRVPALVELVTEIGGRRVVQRPYGEDLPRIC